MKLLARYPILLAAVLASCASEVGTPEPPANPTAHDPAVHAPAVQPRANGKPEIRYYEISDA